MASHYQVFNNWLFDGNIKTQIPKPKIDNNGKEIIPDILKYNSPINSTYIIKLFLNNGPLNYYLDKWFNNINLRYLDKKELFFFIKKAVIDYKITKRDIVFYQYRRKDKIFDKLKLKFPFLKSGDIDILCDTILKSPNKINIMESLGLVNQEKVKKNKKKKGNKNNSKKNKITYKSLIEENFSMMDI